MRKFLFLALIITLPLFFLSCEEDENDSEWKTVNETAFNNIVTNPDYKAVTTPGGPEPVYCKVLKAGIGTEHPIQTAQVKAFYQGRYYEGTVFDQGTYSTEVPTTFNLDQVVRGFSIALQNMVVGDKWEVWIPWTLGYGANGLYVNGVQKIPGYSTLVFTVEVLEITQYPDLY